MATEVHADPGAGVQFYLGPANTGAQPHSHAHAWNMLAWGSKLWQLFGLLVISVLYIIHRACGVPTEYLGPGPIVPRASPYER